MKEKTFVLDCSVALAWSFLDEQDDYALNVLRSLKDARAIVPALWPFEVANGLLMGERRKRSTEVDTVTWLGSIAALPIDVETRQMSQLFAAVAPLARLHNLTSYDASYLELAIRRGLPVATSDAKIQAAMKALGLKVYRPKAARKKKGQ